MSRPEDSLLGREVAYPTRHDPSLLFPIPRAAGRAELGLHGALPFAGVDRWHAYELSWLDARGKPVVATATFTVPADSPHLVESKSLKLYLNSINAHRFHDKEAARATIAHELARAAGAEVQVAFGLPPIDAHGGGARAIDLDALGVDIAADGYGPPQPAHLQADDGHDADETLASQLLKSNCPVTGQPDWASVRIAYRGPRIHRHGLLRYLVSFRDHAGFHEQCVERIFVDVLARCRPRALVVDARYTRRGGLDINPVRATPGLALPPVGRDLRQ